MGGDGDEDGANTGENAGATGMGGMGGMEVPTNPISKSTDEEKYEGLENIPGLFLRNALINEYFGDLVKQEIISVQFRGKSIHAEL